MEKLAQNNVIVALDLQLPPLEVNHKALKDIFNLTRYCLAPVGQDRPNISTSVNFDKNQGKLLRYCMFYGFLGFLGI
jgi:hypothetical protein